MTPSEREIAGKMPSRWKVPTRWYPASRTQPGALAKCLAIPARHGGREEYEPLFRQLHTPRRTACQWQWSIATLAGISTSRPARGPMDKR